MAVHQETLKQAADLQNAINEFLSSNPEYIPTLQADIEGNVYLALVARVGRDENRYRMELWKLHRSKPEEGAAN